MSSVARRDPCAHHRRRPSVTNCVVCAAALCPDCVVHTPVGFKCSSCTTRVVTAPMQTRSGMRGRRAGSLVAVAVLIVGGVTAYGLSRRGSGGGTVYAHANQGNLSDSLPIDQAVRFAGAGGLLMGANLMSPAGSGQHSPGVLIVPDTTSADRNGPAVPGGTPDPLYEDLAQGLAQNGISSLRYDPRGVGESTLPAGTPLRLSDMVDDAKGGLEFLTGRADVDAAHLAVLGEGAGGLVALQLAAQDPAVKALILVSTPGRPLPASLADEVRALAPTPADGDALATQLQTTAAAVVTGAPVPGPAQLPSALRPIFPPGEDAFLRSLFSFDPPGVARSVHLPVLLVRGGADPSNTAADAQALVTALGARAQLMVADQANHTLNLVSVVAAGVASSPVSHVGTMTGRAIVVRDTATLTAVAEWVGAQFRAPPV
ncbi:MAG TPA: alpha/beta fold hydrolase, partial [Actinomycetota bacterium]|nr:alpha/beta fold hydrolase [Actinomycetota bacterium]